MDESNLYDLYVNQKLSTTDIAKRLNISKSKSRRLILKLGFIRSRREGFTLAIPKMGLQNKGKKRIVTDQWKHNQSLAAIKRWDNGKLRINLKNTGYYEINQGINKGRRLHDVIMEIHIGRKLKSNEVVHHINGIKTDNEIINLQLMTKSEHSRLHAKENYSNRKINKKGQFV